jgi:GAF domain-containing protein/HAMP domain-containing protein
MTKTPIHPPPAARKKGKGSSLTGTLVRTLLILIFIPLALMAGTAYFRTRALLREQAVAHAENLLTNQLRLIDREIQARENTLQGQAAEGDFSRLIEIGLHANPQSDQFRSIRSEFIRQFQAARLQNGKPLFDQFLLVNTKGEVKIASNETWQGSIVDPSLLQRDEGFPSAAVYGLAPIYESEFILVTAVEYKTARGSMLGIVAGITEKENLQQLIQPLNGLAPLAGTYFFLSDNRFISNDPQSGAFNLVDPNSASQGELAARLSDLMHRQSPASESLDVLTPEGEPALAQMQWFPRMQSGIVLETRTGNIYNEVASLVPFTVLLVVGTLAGMGLVLIAGTRRVIRPLQSLTAITRRFAEGDWSQRADVLKNDEVGALAASFNHMADQLSEIYRSLEEKVEERTRQIQTAAMVAQNVTAISSLDEMLNKTAELMVRQFGFYQASIFLVDRGGKYADFKAGYGPATREMTEKRFRLQVGSASLVGWVSANNQPRIASDVSEDPLYLKYEALPETRSEASVPISLGSLVLGVLDVQSVQPAAFGKDTLILLQTLASQVATAVQTVELVERSQVNVQEIDRLYHASQRIVSAASEEEILNAGGVVLKEAPYPVIFFRAENGLLKILASGDRTKGLASINGLRSEFQANIEETSAYLARGVALESEITEAIPTPFRSILRALEMNSAALLPVRKHDALAGVVMFGARDRSLSKVSIQPYANFADLMSTALEKVEAVRLMEKRLREVESLASINELIASAPELDAFFRALLEKVQQIIGDYSLTVALYDEKSNTISIPFNYENKEISSIESFPLGEGLTSLLIRTRQPLMLVENTEREAAALGAKVVGRPARSWMGAPMLVQNNPIGALILQDLEKEHAFDEDDLKFFITVAGQVAGVIHNARLLDESKRKALQLETAAEIARDISGSLDLDELLVKAVALIRERFDFYHAAVFLRDLPGEFAVIREATGNAGAQMKRAGYKIGIGSKSIVGFVSGRGEALVVNDTARDATYYANPLLPDTRAEAAFPLKVGERILGVLDVQSTQPFVFYEDNLRSLQILADQLAVAVANTELFAETQEHLSQHRLLHHITTTAASGSTIEEALESAVNGLQVTLGGDRVAILLADREKKTLEIKAAVGYAGEIAEIKVEFGHGITGWVAAHRRPLRIRDVREDPRYIEISANTRSELAVPLIYRNELLGVLNVESEQVDAYSDNDEEMLGTLGGSLAAIIANARLLEQIRLQAERERLIYEVTSRIRRSTDIQSILVSTASEITRITGARYARIDLQPGNNKEEAE